MSKSINHDIYHLICYLIAVLLTIAQSTRCQDQSSPDVLKEVIMKEQAEIDQLRQQIHPGSLRSVDLLAANYFRASLSTGLRSVTTETKPRWYMAHARMENTLKDESYIDYVLGFGVTGPLITFLAKDDPDFDFLDKETKLRQSAAPKKQSFGGFFDRYFSPVFDPKNGSLKKEDKNPLVRVDAETRSKVDTLFDRYLTHPCQSYADAISQKEQVIAKYHDETSKWNDYENDQDDSKKQLVFDFLLNRVALSICKHIIDNRDKYRLCATSNC